MGGVCTCVCGGGGGYYYSEWSRGGIVRTPPPLHGYGLLTKNIDLSSKTVSCQAKTKLLGETKTKIGFNPMSMSMFGNMKGLKGIHTDHDHMRVGQHIKRGNVLGLPRPPLAIS